MNQTIILFAGKKQSGRTTAAKFAYCYFVNKQIGKERLVLEKTGKIYNIRDTFNGNIVAYGYNSDNTRAICDTFSVRMYSFREYLKKICIDVFGLDPNSCANSSDQSGPTHIVWDDFPDQIRQKYSRAKRGIGGVRPASGFICVNELMNVLYHDVFLRIDQNCWSRSAYSLIKSDNYRYSILDDASSLGDVTIGTENGAKSILLLKNQEQDDGTDVLPYGEYSWIIDNSKLDINGNLVKIKGFLDNLENQ